jgi:hypothetical protein
MAGILFEELAVAESEATATEDLGKSVRYNDTRDDNERATYCIIHQLFPINTLRLMSASDVNLSIFFVVFHQASDPSPSPL